MTTKIFPNGLGGTLGDQLDTCKPLWTSGNVWYVNSVGGVDAASPAGQNRENPLATVAQAITNAADDDTVVFLSTHTQTLTAVTTVNKRLTFVGEGFTSGKPAVSFLLNTGAGTDLFSVTAANVEFRNLYFPAMVQGTFADKINAQADGCKVFGCYFEMGANDLTAAFRVSTAGGTINAPRLTNCTFISTATASTAQPKGAIAFAGAGTVAQFEMTGCVLSGGAAGFSSQAMDLSASTATQMRILGLSLLLGADAKLGSSATGLVNVQTATGGSRVDWT